MRNQEGKQKGLKSRSNVKINIKLPGLHLNWKPDVLLLVLDLLKKYNNRNGTDSLREDDLEMRSKGQEQIDRNEVFRNLRENKRFMEMS